MPTSLEDFCTSGCEGFKKVVFHFTSLQYTVTNMFEYLTARYKLDERRDDGLGGVSFHSSTFKFEQRGR